MTKTEMEGHFRGLLKKDNTATAICTHLLILLGSFFALYAIGIIHYLPTDQNVIHWDAQWYFSVRSLGYVFAPSQPCNLAFFPLFPYFWKLSHLSGLLICLANAIIFYFSFYILTKNKNLPFILTLLLLSLPSGVFFNLPYSEAIFFLFGTILLKGYESGSPPLKILAFFGLSLTRSVSIIFIPAILLTEFFAYDVNAGISKRLKNIVIDVFSCLSGLFFTAFIEWQQTGRWFYFYEVQKFWGRHWIMPNIPLTTYNPTIVLGIDAVAYIIGFVAVFYCIKWFISGLNEFKLPLDENPKANKAVYFSALYIAATFLLDTFFTFNDKLGGNIWSINRHILCTPFAIIFIIWVCENLSKSIKDAYIIAAFIIFGIIITGVYRYHIMLAYYLLFLASMAVYIYLPKKRNWLLITYLVSLLLQINNFEHFLANVFVG